MQNYHSNLKCNNAGEFLSSEFRKMLTDKGIHQTTCPPHVHRLNGVAERAIRSVMEQVRVNLVASNLLPVSFWAYAVQHGVDVLNRTTCPPDSNLTSFEVMRGKQPKVMGILPFGCRAHVVRPKEFVRKGSIDAHAWVSANLGRSASSPGAYNAWVPATAACARAGRRGGGLRRVGARRGREVAGPTNCSPAASGGRLLVK